MSSLFSPDLLKKGGFEGLRAKAQTCFKCSLAQSRQKVVYGHGNTINPLVAFVGEAPGITEDEQGVPFTGASGVLLFKLLEPFNLGISNCFFTNLVLCRGKTPMEEEFDQCEKHLVDQILFVKPKVIVALGTSASLRLTKDKRKVEKTRGNWYDWKEIPVLPTYHPATIMRNERLQVSFERDLTIVSERVKQ